jgi:lipid-A-disaccharide synthase
VAERAVSSRRLLFTAFEPSGDDHAAGVIAELRRRHPSLDIFAWGGPKMERAGATIVERTGDDAVMGMPGFAKIREHQRINARIADWLDKNPVSAHIPVDSPAANFPICELSKARGIKVVHLVAPQIWAWGRWRIHKLRRMTDMVLCLLPFEQRFFEKRNVPAKFIGHVLFDKTLDLEALDSRAEAFGEGKPRIAMMPGSRPDELLRHVDLLLDTFGLLKKKHPQAIGVIAVGNAVVKDQLDGLLAGRPGGLPVDVKVVVQDTDAVIRWCTIALVKSGTVTLQVAKQLKPMVAFYTKANPLFFLAARAVLATKLFCLPNVVAGRRIVPEFIPHWGGAEPIAAEALKLLDDPAAAERQRADLIDLCTKFEGKYAAGLAADAIEEVADIVRRDTPSRVGRIPDAFDRPLTRPAIDPAT